MEFDQENYEKYCLNCHYRDGFNCKETGQICNYKDENCDYQPKPDLHKPDDSEQGELF